MAHYWISLLLAFYRTLIDIMPDFYHTKVYMFDFQLSYKRSRESTENEILKDGYVLLCRTPLNVLRIQLDVKKLQHRINRTTWTIQCGKCKRWLLNKVTNTSNVIVPPKACIFPHIQRGISYSNWRRLSGCSGRNQRGLTNVEPRSIQIWSRGPGPYFFLFHFLCRLAMPFYGCPAKYCGNVSH